MSRKSPVPSASEKVAATLGPEKRLQKSGWGENLQMTRQGSVLFWGSLAMVVAVLLVVITRLLPKSPPTQ